jgi:ABC-type multidrug transport system permease subunit
MKLQEVEKIYYFIKRDMTSFSTYKTNMTLMVLGALFGALSYAYLGSNASMQSVLEMYHISFKDYLVIGVAFSTYIGQALTLVQATATPWQLEEVLVSPTRLCTFIIGSSAWGFIWSTVVVIIYLAVGTLAFGVVLSVNLVGTVLVLGLGIGTLVGFSMIGAGILIVVKQGDPVTWLMGILTSVFGNVLFPPQVMPYPLRVISYFVPQYYFFTCIRLMMIGRSIQTILPELLTLTLMCAIILPLGYLIYSWCLRTARKNGTLSWF